MNNLKNKKAVRIAVTASCTDLLNQAQELAIRLGLPMESSKGICAAGTDAAEQERLLLKVSDKGLELLKPDDAEMKGAVRVDFTAGRAVFRRKQQKKELLVRAVEGKGAASLNIIDATGGLGKDSFLLAAVDHQVSIFEREPIIATLLADGLKRAAAYPETAEICERIRLTEGDAVSALKAMRNIGTDEEGKGSVDVVYLDPMFPARRKSALVKKELQVLQLLARSDSAPEQLLKAALQVATRRVVVKRPVKAPFLADCSPSYSLSGKTVRFDVYLGGGRLVSRNRAFSG